MALPESNAAPIHFVRFGFRVAGKLKRHKLTALEASVLQVSREVLAHQRAFADTSFEGIALRAVRDAIDDDMDEAVRWARLQLAGRTTQAVQEAPYTQIFPQGVGYYTVAPLSAQQTRYTELTVRLVENLPEDDPVRLRTAADIERLLPEWLAARTTLSDHQATIAVARTRIDASKQEWQRILERTYGAVVIDMGKSFADNVFKSPARPGQRPDEDADDVASADPDPTLG
jgi:hypothetical protein